MDVPGHVIDALNGAKRPLIIGHVTPDTDALGSMLALARALPAEAAAVSLPGGVVSHRQRFMLELAGGVTLADPAWIANTDVAVVVDTAATSRVNVAGGWDGLARKTVVNIDHHITNPDFGRFNWIVDNASSTCEMVCRLIDAAAWPFDATTASLLYAGIYADTDGFSLPSATADSFEIVARLVRAGADIERVGQRLRRSQAPHEFDLIRAVYHNTRVTPDGLIAYSTLSYDEILSTGCTPQDIDDQVSIPRSLSGIKIAMLFSEGEPGLVRINLRGEDGTPVLPIAERLGGGGHTFSAGVRVRDQIDQVVQRVLAEAQHALHAIHA